MNAIAFLILLILVMSINTTIWAGLLGLIVWILGFFTEMPELPVIAYFAVGFVLAFFIAPLKVNVKFR